MKNLSHYRIHIKATKQNCIAFAQTTRRLHPEVNIFWTREKDPPYPENKHRIAIEGYCEGCVDATTSDIDVDSSVLTRKSDGFVANSNQIAQMNLSLRSRSKLFEAEIWCNETIEGYGQKLTHCKFGKTLPLRGEMGMPGCLDWQHYDSEGFSLNEDGFVIDSEGNELISATSVIE